MLFLLLLVRVIIAHTRNEVILSAGVGNYSRLSLHDQYMTYQTYADIGLISASSILAYQISVDGMLEEWPTYDSAISAEGLQYSIKTKFDLKAYPCIFCDATIGACSNLGMRTDRMLSNQHAFIVDSIERAMKYGWDGYIVDFEPDSPLNITGIAHFMVDWAEELYQRNMTLWLWIGSTALYDFNIVSASPHIKYVTMSTYVTSYNDFINIASILQTQIGIDKLSFGLFTYPTTFPISESDMLLIVDWLNITKSHSINLWAASVPPGWYKGLTKFLAN